LHKDSKDNSNIIH